MAFRIKQVYEAENPADGERVLVDRLWPRGLRKADAQLTCWMKEVAPSPRSRQWFGHDPERFADFRARYTAELQKNPAAAALRAAGLTADRRLFPTRIIVTTVTC